MVATHLHVLPDEVRNMAYIDYNDCVKEIAIKINYESISNLLGNSHCPDSGKVVSDASPFNYKETDSNGRIKSNLPKVTKEMMMALMDKEQKK